MAWTEVDSVIRITPGRLFLEEPGWAAGAGLGPLWGSPKTSMAWGLLPWPTQRSISVQAWVVSSPQVSFPEVDDTAMVGGQTAKPLIASGSLFPAASGRVHPITSSLPPWWPLGSNSYWGRLLGQWQIVRRMWGPQPWSGWGTTLSPASRFLPGFKIIF